MKIAALFALSLLATGCVAPGAMRERKVLGHWCAFEVQRPGGKLGASWRVALDGSASPVLVGWRTAVSPGGLGFQVDWYGSDFGRLPDDAEVGIWREGPFDHPPVRLSIWQGDPPAPGPPAVAGPRNIGGGGVVHLRWGEVERLAAGGSLTLGAVDDAGQVTLPAVITPAMLAAIREALGLVRSEFAAVMAGYSERCDVDDGTPIVVT